MKCPFNNEVDCRTECIHVDTSSMTKIKECSECAYYGDGVQYTGATPCLGWLIDKIKLLWYRIV
jgi:hypothetical protein